MSHSVSQEKSPVFITTPIYYVNAKPHLGHAFTTLVADSMARFLRQQGRKVTLVTGTDEHGEKIEKVASERGKSPLEYANEYSEYFRSTWMRMGIEADIFYRTTSPKHYELVKNVLASLKDRGEIYFATYEGKYCVGCERYRTDQEWDAEGLCPDHRKPPEIREESNYFFKMSAYQQKLIEFYQSHPEVIQPSHYLTETLAMLKEPLEDLCISRPSNRLRWGIPLPFDEKYVTYVWFDALLNYIGALGYDGKNPASLNRELWAGSHHFIGKDILKTHAVYWPTMLMALGMAPFHLLHVHGFWLMAGMKMSKSLGNVVDPMEIEERYGSEVFRYYLMREMSFGLDSQFSLEGFVQRINADLANGIGNLASRVLALVHKYLEGKVPSKKSRTAQDAEVLAKIREAGVRFQDEFAKARFHQALSVFSETVALCDRYVNEKAPWTQGKDPAKIEELRACLGTLMDALADLAVMMASVLPSGSRELLKALGQKSDGLPLFSSLGTGLTEGALLGERPKLYPRIELAPPAP
jgi:methionyl-tRNA synthetase